MPDERNGAGDGSPDGRTQSGTSADRFFYLRVVLSFVVFVLVIIAIVVVAQFVIDPNTLILGTAPLYLTLWGIFGSITAVLYSIYRKFNRKEFGWDHFIKAFFRVILGGFFATISFFVIVVALKVVPWGVGDAVSEAVAKSGKYEEYRAALTAEKKAETEYAGAKAELEAARIEGGPPDVESPPVEGDAIRTLEEREKIAAKTLLKTQTDLATYAGTFKSAELKTDRDAVARDVRKLEARKAENTSGILKWAALFESAEGPSRKGDEGVAAELESKRLRVIELDTAIKELEVAKSAGGEEGEPIPRSDVKKTPGKGKPEGFGIREMPISKSGLKVYPRRETETGGIAMDDELTRLRCEREMLEGEILIIATESAPTKVAEAEITTLQENKSEVDEKLTVAESEIRNKEEAINEALCREEEGNQYPPWKNPLLVLIAIIAGFFIDSVPRKLEMLRDKYLGKNGSS
ncbi:MAG TPA: hypothetical protein VMW93_08700 [bacterium]|nr:hypothetical protein [bacterium]